GLAAPPHLALGGPDRATVAACHAAALGAGGTDNGAPGLRPQYHETYYSSYVIDLDGHNVEAVCHAPEQRWLVAARFRPRSPAPAPCRSLRSSSTTRLPAWKEGRTLREQDVSGARLSCAPLTAA